MTRRFFRNNKGFSLIELLVAVAILVVVVGVIGRAFVMSTLLNRKGRDLGDQTLAAQNIVEMVRTVGVHDFILKVGDGVLVGPPEAEAAPFPFLNEGAEITRDGENTYRITNIRAGHTTFDALLEFCKSAWDGDDNLNRDYTNFIDMTNVHFQADEAPSADEDAIGVLAGLLGVDFGVMDVWREIVLTFNRDTESTSVIISVQYLYYYNEMGAPEEHKELFWETIDIPIKTDGYTVEGGVITDNIDPVYLCFQPFSTPYGINKKKDIIKIYNNVVNGYNSVTVSEENKIIPAPAPQPVTCEVFLVVSNPLGYGAEIIVYEPTGNDNDRRIDFFTNLNPAPHSSFKGYRRGGTILVDPSWPNNVSDTWVKKEHADRMWDVTVTLFPRGGGFTNAITTIEATHLEYTLVSQEEED